ncbi:TIGR03987 family protein [Clostridium felsineum]|uniref:HsmA family protein n=1 Tax=Clostridium felsineum TaxID=36839 RepID=UPI00098C5EC2|nr:HsmA family protein [Clostridium felsineum]MCR3757554.1 TIGR03987 family protein [Clostridium felsineum]URZ14483.1 hypothetical protein CLFE_004800 [Clostridium felsineum DSM 794]
MLIYAIITITLALVFYTTGVFSEKKHGNLKKIYVYIFWCGLIFDITGTTLMSTLSKNSFEFNFHGITGLIAILLMFFHVIWATIVLIKNNERAKANFHKLSIIVWLIWLIPYISGMILGMKK